MASSTGKQSIVPPPPPPRPPPKETPDPVRLEKFLHRTPGLLSSPEQRREFRLTAGEVERPRFRPDDPNAVSLRPENPVTYGNRDLSCKVAPTTILSRAESLAAGREHFHPRQTGSALGLVQEKETLNHGGTVVGVPRRQPVDVPPDLDAPPALASPARRRELLEFEVKNRRARESLKKELNAAKKLVEISKNAYPRGVMMVEGPVTQGTAVYIEDRERLEALNQRRTASIAHRRDYIVKHRDSQLPYNLISHLESQDPRAYGPPAKVFNSKGREGNLHTPWEESPEADDTYHANLPRMQNIRNRESNGRDYDIVSHRPYTRMPPSVAESVNRRLAHPSMQDRGEL
eukprot:tig00000194_g14811.t1